MLTFFHVELFEYNMQQKQSQMLEMQVELGSVKDRAAELQEQLSAEKTAAAELRSELAQTKLELETTLKAQHKHLKELEAFRCARLLDYKPVLLVKSEVAQSCPTLRDPMDCSPQAPLSMGFSRQEYWSGLPFPSPLDLPDQGLNPGLPHCRQTLYHLSHQGSHY